MTRADYWQRAAAWQVARELAGGRLPAAEEWRCQFEMVTLWWALPVAERPLSEIYYYTRRRLRARPVVVGREDGVSVGRARPAPEDGAPLGVDAHP